MNEVAELKRTIGDFVAWAGGYPVDCRSGEWEVEYERWPEIATAFATYLEKFTPDQWDEEVIDLLIFILARDNEGEILKQELVNRPDHLLALAKASITSTERDARWQLADALGDSRFDSGNAEQLLELFLSDEDEYVRRRALLAMGRRHSPGAEIHAVRAWDTGEEYQRLAALGVLAEINSSLLMRYLTLAEEDGREYLTNYAKNLRQR
jgi:hypothetical protein